jgi:hypothetical protein
LKKAFEEQKLRKVSSLKVGCEGVENKNRTLDGQKNIDISIVESFEASETYD